VSSATIATPVEMIESLPAPVEAARAAKQETAAGQAAPLDVDHL